MDQSTVRTILRRARQEGRTTLTAAEAGAICSAYDIPVPVSVPAVDPDAAVAAAHSIGYPVALKLLSSDITHKSDVGGVQLDLQDEVAVRRAFEDIIQNARRHEPTARIDGALAGC